MAIKIKIRIFFWALLTVAAFWFLWQAVVPFGHIVYVNDFKGDNYFIRKLTPAERVDYTGENSARITGDPAYFSLRTPRRFDNAKLILVYRRGDAAEGAKLPAGSLAPSAGIIEAGILADKKIWRYDLKPLENRGLDPLFADWAVIREGGTVLLQREKKYGAIGDFLADLPPPAAAAVYNYNLPEDFILDDYEANSEETVISNPLRGAYQFYFYTGGEAVRLDFIFSDMDENSDADPIDISIYARGQVIEERHLPDEGAIRRLSLEMAGLPAGVYKAEVRAGDDIITDELRSAQRKLSFDRRLWLADGGAGNIRLITNSARLQALTANPASLGKISVSEEVLEVAETYRQFEIKTASSVSEIVLESGDLIISGDGVFAFSEEALFNPRWRQAGRDFDPDRQGIDYVIARYAPPLEQDGWRTAAAVFDLRRAYREDGQYGFIISVPGLRADDEIRDFIELKEIKVELSGRTLFEKIREYLK